jgi:uncharacterized protein (DUF433 family)
MDDKIISRDPDVMSGTAVFAGTRVPVQTLLDYLEAGETIDDFLAGFPGVSRPQVIDFLEQAKDRLIGDIVGEAVRDWQLKRTLVGDDAERLGRLWDEGIASGSAGEVDFPELRSEIRRRLTTDNG